jgi:DNA-binding HxlR family transcriptional regulator
MKYKNRSYNQYCGLAYALVIIGERWTWLIVRKLVAGPRRFKDLLDGLPGTSTDSLSERLKGLEQQGMSQRRRLPPLAGSAVYELTAIARGVGTTLLELGTWDSQYAGCQAQLTNRMRQTVCTWYYSIRTGSPLAADW